MEGVSLVSRVQYRKAVGMSQGKRAVAKHEVAKFENLQAEYLDKHDRNEFFGFKCLHYSVSESIGKLTITVENKSAKANRVQVKTVDDQAVAGEDFVAVDQILEFRDGQKTQNVEVEIMDDDDWEPDEDFFVQLFDVKTGLPLSG